MNASCSPIIRAYRHGDHVGIAEIFVRAVHEIASEVYSDEQCLAWSDRTPNPEHWRIRCERKQPFVTGIGGRVVAFLELDYDGHIDCAYVHPDFKRRGIMSRLVRHAIKECASRDIERLNVEASLCARPMFEKLGFRIVREKLVFLGDVALANFDMEFDIGKPSSSHGS